MKRTVKNIIMILLLIIMIGGNIFTMYYFKSNNSSVIEVGSSGNSGGTPPDNSNSGNSDSSTSSPPDLPSDSSDNEKIEDSDPPEKPDGEDSSGEQKEKPSGDDSSIGDDIPSGDTPSDIPSGSGEIASTNNTSSTSLELEDYLILGGEDLIIAIILMYLILSGFNKKSFKETFHSSDRVMIYILMIIILTPCLTYLDHYLIKNVISSSSSNNSSNDNMNNSESSSDIVYSSETEITEDTTITSGSYSSTNADSNAISVSGDIEVSLSNITVLKSGSSNGGDDSNFYGTNSAIIAKNGAYLKLSNITVSTTGDGANGVFSYGGSATTNNSSSDGTTIEISDSTITTEGDNAGGIMTTGGGKTIASNLTITTSGTSSAAIRSDRGGGTVTVDGGTYTTTGSGSPAIYSTAEITVSNADLVSKTSEGIVIEGANSVTIDNCNLTDSNTKLNGQSTTYKNIFLYQSMSGDASSGTASFSASNSKIITNNGDTLYVTNTTAAITLENNTITNNDSSGNFLRIQKDSWGNEGSNGGDVTLKLINQEVSGNIVVDSISTLDMTLSDNSSYEGTINGDNSAEEINLTLDASSSIKLTGDSYVTSLTDSDSNYSNIDFNGYKLYVNGKAIN